MQPEANHGLEEALISSSPDPTEEEEAEESSQVPKYARFASLDLCRGLIMMIMAWDHVTHVFTSLRDQTSQFEHERWEGKSSTYDGSYRKFVARSVSHVCAPGFFLTMGISMVLFTHQRRAKHHWSWFQVVFKHYLIRGLLLLFIEYCVDLPGFLPKLVDLVHGREVLDYHAQRYEPGEEGKLIFRSLLGIYEVMTSLGLTMILTSLTLPIWFRIFQDSSRTRGAAALFSGLGLFLLTFLLSCLIIVSSQPADPSQLNDPPSSFPHFPAIVVDPEQFLLRVLFLPGTFFAEWEFLFYPVFPWIGMTWLGVGLGFVYISENQTPRLVLKALALLFGLLFPMIRGFGGKLNIRGIQRGEDPKLPDSPVLEFITLTKYPPDLSYATITLALVFSMILVFDFSEAQLSSERNILLVFGRTPLFFYLCHFWIMLLLEALCRLPDPPTGKFDLQYVVLVWLLVVFIMYQLCVRYHAFKTTTPHNSVWRML